MKIELKKLKISIPQSEETIAFTADLYINGINAGYVKNSGTGGPNDITPYHGAKSLIDKAEKYCQSLPLIDGLKMDLEFQISLLVEDEMKNKEAAKMERKMIDSILWGVPGGSSYKVMKFNIKLCEIRTELLQAKIDSIRSKMKAGEEFLNTNFKQLNIQ